MKEIFKAITLNQKIAYRIQESNSEEFQSGKDPLDLRLELWKGWNLISISILPDNNTVTHILGDRVINPIWTWDNEEKKFNRTYSILPSKAYWVYAQDNYLGKNAILVELP